MTTKEIAQLETLVRETYAKEGTYTHTAKTLSLELKDVIYIMKGTTYDKQNHFKTK